MKHFLIILTLLLPAAGPAQTDLEKQIIEIIENGIFHPTSTVDYPTFRNLENLNIYPNPTNKTINITFNSYIKSEIQLNFISLQGRRVLETYIQAERGKNYIALNISSLPVGSYVLYLQSGNEVETTIVNILK